MIVEQIWTANTYRNFNYLIACPESGEALAIDPLDRNKRLATAKSKGWDIRQILNTHEHGGHTGVDRAMIAATGVKLLAHKAARNRISGIDRGLGAGGIVKVGKTVELEFLDTPGQTMAHVCLLSRTDTPALFCGDTLFNAGAGNCHGGGHPHHLYDTFANQLARLPNETLVYPGHDYIANNLGFTLNWKPHNEKATRVLEQIRDQDLNQATVSTLALEKAINSFFRLSNPAIIAGLRELFPDVSDKPNPETVFLKLRELRNSG